MSLCGLKGIRTLKFICTKKSISYNDLVLNIELPSLERINDKLMLISSTLTVNETKEKSFSTKEYIKLLMEASLVHS